MMVINAPVSPPSSSLINQQYPVFPGNNRPPVIAPHVPTPVEPEKYPHPQLPDPLSSSSQVSYMKVDSNDSQQGYNSAAVELKIVNDAMKAPGQTLVQTKIISSQGYPETQLSRMVDNVSRNALALSATPLGIDSIFPQMSMGNSLNLLG